MRLKNQTKRTLNIYVPLPNCHLSKCKKDISKNPNTPIYQPENIFSYSRKFIPLVSLYPNDSLSLFLCMYGASCLTQPSTEGGTLTVSLHIWNTTFFNAKRTQKLPESDSLSFWLASNRARNVELILLSSSSPTPFTSFLNPNY